MSPSFSTLPNFSSFSRHDSNGPEDPAPPLSTRWHGLAAVLQDGSLHSHEGLQRRSATFDEDASVSLDGSPSISEQAAAEAATAAAASGVQRIQQPAAASSAAVASSNADAAAVLAREASAATSELSSVGDASDIHIEHPVLSNAQSREAGATALAAAVPAVITCSPAPLSETTQNTTANASRASVGQPSAKRSRVSNQRVSLSAAYLVPVL